MAHTPTTTDRRLNLKVTPETAAQLEQLAARYRRTLSGQAAWLIEEAHQRLQKEQG